MALRLKSRTEMPPEGIIIEIPQLGMTRANNRHRQYWSATEAVEAFKAIALKNPRFGLPTDDEAIWNYLSQSNAIRVSNIPGAEIYLVREGGVAAALKKALKPPKLVAVAEKLNALNAGARLLTEWIGDGAVPVSSQESESRASICVQCPHNGKGDLLRYFTTPASEEVRKYLERTRDSKLTTPQDSRLGICEICSCPLKLKVHAPLDLILKHLTPEVKGRLWSKCWITNP